MRSELRSSLSDFNQLAQAPRFADELLQVGLQEIIDEHAELQNVLELEQQRLIAKYGEESIQAKTAALRLELHGEMKLGIKVYSERLRIPTPTPAPDRFVLYGRVLNSEGDGLPNLTVEVIDTKSRPIVETKTDGDGGFELPLSTANHQAGVSSDTINVESIGSVAEKLQLRLQVLDRRRKTLYLDEQPFEVTAGVLSYREILVGGTVTPPKKTRTTEKRLK